MKQLGRFSFYRQIQVAPFNAFVSLPWLQEKLGLTNRANLLLIPQIKREWHHQGLTQSLDHSAELFIPEIIDSSENSAEEANSGIGLSWQLPDAQLELRELPNDIGVELRTQPRFSRSCRRRSRAENLERRRADSHLFRQRPGIPVIPYALFHGHRHGRSGWCPPI